MVYARYTEMPCFDFGAGDLRAHDGYPIESFSVARHSCPDPNFPILRYREDLTNNAVKTDSRRR